jgi:hypothetical protein
MRTTITIDDHLLREAKAEALRTNRTLGEVVSEGLRSVLGRRRKSDRQPRASLITFKGSGMLPGIDLDDSGELLTRLESPDAAL